MSDENDKVIQMRPRELTERERSVVLTKATEYLIASIQLLKTFVASEVTDLERELKSIDRRLSALDRQTDTEERPT